MKKGTITDVCTRGVFTHAPTSATHGSRATPGSAVATVSAARSAVRAIVMAVVLTVALTANSMLSPQPVNAAPAFPELCTQVASVAGREPAVTTGVVVMDLASGDRCAINADRTYRSASLYKLVVVAELYRQVEEGLIDLQQPLVVEPRHAIDDAPGFRITEPYTISVYGAAERMITFSDNGTAFALRELLGLAQVDQATDWLGMPATSLGATFRTSANDQSEYLARLYRREIVSPEASEAILDLMMRQEITDMIPRGLPAGVPIAHKTGTLDTFLHDSSIIFAPGGNYVLVVMTESNSLETAMSVIQEVARTTFGAYTEPLISPDVTSILEESALLMEVSTSGGTAVGPAVDANSPIATIEATPSAVFLDERPSSVTLVDTFTDPAVLTVLLVVAGIAIIGPVMMLRRRPAVRYGDTVLSPQDARLRADRSERGLVMRFGSRRDDDSRPVPPTPASYSVSEVAEQPVLPSRRLQRLAEHFRTQGELLVTMRDQFEDEMEPLHELIVHQAQAMQALLQNLEERLRPLNE